MANEENKKDAEIKRIQTCIDNLNNLIETLEKLKQGLITKQDLVHALNVKEYILDEHIENSFTNYLHFRKLFTDKDIKTILYAYETPYEKLAKDIFNLSKTNDIVIINDIQESQLMNILETHLPDTERNIIIDRYGLSGNEPMKYSQLGAKYKTEGATIIQIIETAFGRLRSYKTARLISDTIRACVDNDKCDIYSLGNYPNQKPSDMDNLTSNVRETIQKLGLSDINWLAKLNVPIFNVLAKDWDDNDHKSFKTLCKDKNIEMKPIGSTIDADIAERITLDMLGLKTRTINALRRNNIHNLRDLTRMGNQGVKNMYGIGGLMYDEIIAIKRKCDGIE